MAAWLLPKQMSFPSLSNIIHPDWFFNAPFAPKMDMFLRRSGKIVSLTYFVIFIPSDSSMSVFLAQLLLKPKKNLV